MDYLIEGIPDENLKDQARMQQFLNVESLLNAFEKISLKNKKNHASERSKETQSKFENNKTIENFEKKEVRIKRRCYNCGDYSHLSYDCKKEKREKGACFKCSSNAHSIKDCPLMKDNVKFDISVVESISRENEFYRMIALEFDIDNDVYVIEILSLLDSGSPITFVKEKLIKNELIEKVESDLLDYAGINGSKLNITGKIIVNCTLNSIKKPMLFYVVADDSMRPNAILGRDFFKEFDLRIVDSSNELKFIDNEIFNIDILNLEEKDSDNLIINPNISTEIKDQLIKIFEITYVQPEKPLEPKVKSELILRLKNDQPFYFKPRRLSFSEKEDVKILVDDLLSRGVIKQSSSEYCSPIVLVKKKNGQTECVLITDRLIKSLKKIIFHCR